MSIKITIPNTSSDTLTFGSANTPTAAQIAGIDSGSSNGQLAIYTTASGTSTERVRVDSSGNVGIGTATPSYRLDITNGSASANCVIRMTNSGTYGAYTQSVTSNRTFSYGAFDSTNGFVSGSWGVRDETAAAWRMIIDSSGNVLVNATAQIAQGKFGVAFVGSTNQAAAFNETSGASSWTTVLFQRTGTTIGSISNATSSTAYNTSSDYRLKNTIAPMTGALAKVQALKPVTYKWNIDGEAGEGFIAHELAEVCPHAVTGTKDAVDADGNPVYQGIDTSFLVATLTAAIQELKALTDAQASTITALTARITALENK